MPGDAFQSVLPGQKLAIPAAAYNAFLDAARQARAKPNEKPGEGDPEFRQAGIVKVRNDSGADLDRFDVLGLDAPLILPEDNLTEFERQVTFSGVVPAEEHRGRFVVLAEPLAAGSIGRAVVSGVTPVRLTVDSSAASKAFAEIVEGETAALTSDAKGSAQILWQEAGTSSEVWAVVRLGPPPATSEFYVLDPCDSADGEAFLVRNDLKAQLGRVVKVNGVCYDVRWPDDDEFECQDPICVSIEADYSDCARCQGCWKLTPCASGSVITTDTDLADEEGRIVRLDDGNCYTVELADDCSSVQPVTVIESYVSCSECNHCYHLENCHDAADTKVILNDLAALVGKTPDEILDDGLIVEIDGQCYQVTAYDDDCSSAETVTIQETYDSCEECGCFRLTACTGDPPAVIHAREATGPNGSLRLADYLGQVVRLDDGECYLVEEATECDALQSVVVLEAYPDCDACTCWTLEDCNDPATTLLTYTDLSSYGVGTVLRQADTDPVRCWTITGTAVWSSMAEPFVVDNDYPDCPACLGTAKYRLTPACPSDDCGVTSGDAIITQVDLHEAVGKFVKVDGRCYQVETTDTGDVTHPTLLYRGPFATCEACLAAPVDARKRYLTYLRIEGTDVVASTEEMIIRDGRIVGFCPADDITIEGTDCSEE